jgi:mRNA-degrading endonuclease RelE of RelBE toxin-antitoxin system
VDLRKIRVRAVGRGKRGGLRVIYLYLEEQARVVFFAVYAKNVADDLTPEQKKALANAAQQERERGAP